MSSIVLMTFKTTQSALKAEKVLKKKHISFTLTPTPSSISAACGLSIELENKYLEDAKKVLSEKKVRFDKIYNLNAG